MEDKQTLVVPTISNSVILRHEKELEISSMRKDNNLPTRLSIPEITFNTRPGVINLFQSSVKRTHYSNVDPRDILLGTLFVILSTLFYVLVR